MKKIDSDALGVLNKALGLSGVGSRVTELADGVGDLETYSWDDLKLRSKRCGVRWCEERQAYVSTHSLGDY